MTERCQERKERGKTDRERLSFAGTKTEIELKIRLNLKRENLPIVVLLHPRAEDAFLCGVVVVNEEG